MGTSEAAVSSTMSFRIGNIHMPGAPSGPDHDDIRGGFPSGISINLDDSRNSRISTKMYTMQLD